MVERYGREVTGQCQVCGYKGKTQIHHIISQHTIEKLKEGQHGFNFDLKKNPGNLSELCEQCHRLTHSYFFHNWMESLDQEQFEKTRNHRSNYKKKRNSGRGTRTKRSQRRKFRCIGINAKGEQCGIKVETKDTFCKLHKNQSSSKNSNVPNYRDYPMPPLRGWHEDRWEEPILDAEEMSCLQGIHQGWMKVDDYALNLFAEWPEAWKRRWLYLEKW
jgi:hypothetical protein